MHAKCSSERQRDGTPGASEARANTRARGADAGLAPLLPQLRGARWIALLRTGLVCWPPDAALPRGTRELAERAAAAARVSRAVLPAAASPKAASEIIAIPLDPRPGATGSSETCVAVIGLRGEEIDSHADIVRRVRAVLCAGRSPPARTMKAASEEPRLREASAPGGSGASSGEFARTVLEAVGAHGEASACAVACADAGATLASAIAGAPVRVSVGVRRRGAVRLLAVSGESAPDHRREAVRRLERVMADALAIGAGSWKEGGESGAMGEEATRTAVDGVWTCVHDAPSGVLTVAVIEPSAAPFPDAEARRTMEAAIVPALGLVGALERAARRTGRWSWTPRRGTRRRLALAAAALLPPLWAVLALPQPYRVSARVSIEASDRQVLSAPYAGHLGSAHVRAGDAVRAGQLLATLDGREMALDASRWAGELASNGAEQAMALAGRDRVELARLRADAARIEVERSLAEERRARAEIRAPFDGILLSGDPARLLGTPLAAGDTLFEIASGDKRSLLVEIDEHDVGLIEAGARVQVRMAAAPRDVIAATLGAVVPVAVAEPGGSVFRARATLAEAAAGEALRPGMQGVARIDAGRRSLADAWTRPVRERLVLYGWKLGLLR